MSGQTLSHMTLVLLKSRFIATARLLTLVFFTYRFAGTVGWENFVGIKFFATFAVALISRSCSLQIILATLCMCVLASHVARVCENLICKLLH